MYFEKGELVGFKVLMVFFYLNYLLVILRYDMVVLEELGFFEKMYILLGRVFFECGYCYYIEYLVIRDNDVIEVFFLIDEVFSKKVFGCEYIIKEVLKLLIDFISYIVVVVGLDIL